MINPVRTWSLPWIDNVNGTERYNRAKRYWWILKWRKQSAGTGAPVGMPGNLPSDPAMSRCVYFSGCFESMPCCDERRDLQTIGNSRAYHWQTLF